MIWIGHALSRLVSSIRGVHRRNDDLDALLSFLFYLHDLHAELPEPDPNRLTLALSAARELGLGEEEGAVIRTVLRLHGNDQGGTAVQSSTASTGPFPIPAAYDVKGCLASAELFARAEECLCALDHAGPLSPAVRVEAHVVRAVDLVCQGADLATMCAATRPSVAVAVWSVHKEAGS